MPETRYIKEFENGVLVNEIPYTVSDAQLAEELADRRMNELRDLLKQGAHVVISDPPSGKQQVINLYRDPNTGLINGGYEDTPV